VNQKPIERCFFVDERSTNGGIRLTDELFLLFELPSAGDLSQEVNARWRLVETAWEMGLSRPLIAVQHDHERELLTAVVRNRRVSITSSRAALNGYQKGKCFYCFADISIGGNDETAADVDHFIPHIAVRSMPGLAVNGIWNLVLACR